MLCVLRSQQNVGQKRRSQCFRRETPSIQSEVVWFFLAGKVAEASFGLSQKRRHVKRADVLARSGDAWTGIIINLD